MIAGIRFNPHGQIYYFSAEMELSVNDEVIVETEQGKGLGKVCFLLDSLPQSEDSVPTGPLVPISRLANDEDKRIGQGNQELSQKAMVFCKKCIVERGLDMKLVDVEVFYDRSKVIFYFTAPARIDFRDLVKDLVREYRARIELRQIGVRHETQMVGAVGNCGMVCCCKRYLRKFAPVTIRMAKEQNLFLNPAKISGVCGRLLCCLSFEQENYDNFQNQCPKLGKKYQTTKGSMKVLRSNMFRHSITVLNEENVEVELTLEDWEALAPKRPEGYKQATAPKSNDKNKHMDELLVVSVGPDSEDLLFDDDDEDRGLDNALLDTDELPAGIDLEDNLDVADGGIFGLAPQKNKLHAKNHKK